MEGVLGAVLLLILESAVIGWEPVPGSIAVRLERAVYYLPPCAARCGVTWPGATIAIIPTDQPRFFLDSRLRLAPGSGYYCYRVVRVFPDGQRIAAPPSCERGNPE
jgi:hypothetical protein